MSEGIGEATQVIRVTMEGTELFIKAAYMTFKEIASLVIAYKSYKEKTLTGEVELKKLLKAADGDIRLLKIPEDRKDEVAEALKKYQIKYSLMPDLNLADGKCEFGFAVTDLPRVNSLIESLKLGEVISNADYVKNADPEVLDKMAKNISENEKKELATEQVANIETASEKAKEFDEQAKVNRQVRDDISKTKIILPGNCVVKQTDTQIKVRLPRDVCRQIYKENAYIWLQSKDILLDKENKDIIFSAEFGSKYMVYDKNDKVIDTMASSRLKSTFEVKKADRKTDLAKKATTKSRSR